MKQYVERMIREKDDLDSKIKRAKQTIQNNPYDMDKTSKMMLAEQIKYMDSYSNCLADRIQYEMNKET